MSPILPQGVHQGVPMTADVFMSIFAASMMAPAGAFVAVPTVIAEHRRLPVFLEPTVLRQPQRFINSDGR